MLMLNFYISDTLKNLFMTLTGSLNVHQKLLQNKTRSWLNELVAYPSSAVSFFSYEKETSYNSSDIENIFLFKFLAFIYDFCLFNRFTQKPH